MKSVILVAMLVGCGVSGDGLHDDVSCDGHWGSNANCERACLDRDVTTGGDGPCTASNPADPIVYRCIETGTTATGERGCCVNADNVIRFFECN